jgi:hypothetical protein
MRVRQAAPAVPPGAPAPVDPGTRARLDRALSELDPDL